MNVNDIIPSRMYSWVYTGELKLNKGGRAGVPVNPFFGRVTVRKVKAGQAATSEMATRKSLALDPSYVPSDRAPQWETTGHECVVRSLSSGDFAVRILSPRTVKVERFLDGKPMTAEEWQTLSATQGWLPARKPRDASKVSLNFVYIHNLANVDGEPAEVEDDN